jgi:hypothetical protein
MILIEILHVRPAHLGPMRPATPMGPIVRVSLACPGCARYVVIVAHRTIPRVGRRMLARPRCQGVEAST